MDQDVIPFDLHRMFLGDLPALFYAEILVRTLIIYFYTLLMIRWVGGRGIAQLSMVEFVLVIALGSAVGDTMFYPDVPILVALLVITAVIGMNKLLDLLILKSDAAKAVIDGRPIQVVHEGRLLPEGMQAADMGPAEIKAMLRVHGIRNLGTVQHAYLESSGQTSIFLHDQPRPGLSLIPPRSVYPAPSVDRRLDDPAKAPQGQVCCMCCGGIAKAEAALPDRPCRHCDGREWTIPECEPRKDAP